MANVLARTILFLSSYIPLWLIFTLILFAEQPKIALAFGVLALLSLAGTVVYFRQVRRFQGIALTVGIIRRKDSDTMSYIASYVIPFAATAFDKVEQVAALAVFLGVLCLVYVNSGMIHINPLLSMLGFSPYEIEDESGNSIFLLTKRVLRRGETVRATEIAHGIYVEKTA